MVNKYEAPAVEVISAIWEQSICILSGGGTENVGKNTELTDNDFE